MAKIDINSISEMHESAGNIRKYCEDFKQTAQQLQQATQTLTESSDGWQSEASQIFRENIDEAKRWMDEMAAVVDEFAAAIDLAGETYTEMDMTASQNFR